MKSIPITPEILASIKAVTGTDIDPASITVFRAIALDTLPLVKPGSLFNGARVRPAVLPEMASYVNGPNGGVPLHTLHMQGEELPVGRLFHGEIVNGELQVLFYLPNATQAQLINDINTGVIDSDSVGFESKQILCSECGWDYKGPDATFLNLFDQTCANGHTIGEDGVHVDLVGLDHWYEMSLVSVGAAKNAKILSLAVFDRAKKQMGEEVLMQLAASGVPLAARVVVSNPKGEDSMSNKELLDKIEEQGRKLAELEASAGKVTGLETELAAAQAKIAELEAKIAAGADTEAKLTAATETVAKATAFLKTHAERALVATGKAAADVPADADVPALITLIEGSQANLVNLFPSARVTAAPKLDGGSDSDARSAFKTRG